MKATQRLSDLKVMSTDQLQEELLKLKKERRVRTSGDALFEFSERILDLGGDLFLDLNQARDMHQHGRMLIPLPPKLSRRTGKGKGL